MDRFTDVSRNKVSEDKKSHDELSRWTVVQQRHNAEMEGVCYFFSSAISRVILQFIHINLLNGGLVL